MRFTSKFVFSLILNLILSQVLPAQKNANWRDKSNTPNVSFYEVQKDFYDYWQDKTPQKGQGYKVFKRWKIT